MLLPFVRFVSGPSFELNLKGRGRNRGSFNLPWTRGFLLTVLKISDIYGAGSSELFDAATRGGSLRYLQVSAEGPFVYDPFQSIHAEILWLSRGLSFSSSVKVQAERV